MISWIESFIMCVLTRSDSKDCITIYYTKKLPLNLRPDIFNTFKPQYDDMKFNSSRFMWKLRNRTIYRDSKAHWLRRSKPLKKEDPETEIKLDQLRNDYTLKILHSDEEFY